ncbi:hypothetical protein [Streptomyces sp. URMC 129]|uniref:hypothetical protein n=1 Tax=Streptomyces sp. URMC 129 TaxID=3423407 RepID=UPI003F1AB070
MIYNALTWDFPFFITCAKVLVSDMGHLGAAPHENPPTRRRLLAALTACAGAGAETESRPANGPGGDSQPAPAGNDGTTSDEKPTTEDDRTATPAPAQSTSQPGADGQPNGETSQADPGQTDEAEAEEPAERVAGSRQVKELLKKHLVPQTDIEIPEALWPFPRPDFGGALEPGYDPDCSWEEGGAPLPDHCGQPEPGTEPPTTTSDNDPEATPGPETPPVPDPEPVTGAMTLPAPYSLK